MLTKSFLSRLYSGRFKLSVLLGKNSLLTNPIKFKFSLSSPQQSLQQTYTQRAYTPSYMSQLLINQISTQKQPSLVQKQLILHQLTLYYEKVLPFDYDYFNQSLKRLVPFQSKLKIQQILMLFDLAIEYKIDSLLLKTHFENQLYCRVYSSARKQLLDYDRKLQEQQNQFFKKLQQKSSDHFQLINQKYKQLFEEQPEQTSQNDGQNNLSAQKEKPQPSQSHLTSTSTFYQASLVSSSKPIYNSSQRKMKPKDASPQLINRITTTYLQSNPRNIELNKLLLQVFTTRLDDSGLALSQSQKQPQGKQPKQAKLTLNASFLNNYTKLSVNLLQLYMSQFHSPEKAKQYSHRSVKNVYKLQTFYYFQIAKMVEQHKLLSQASNQQLSQFVETLSSFPIKRRSFRKSLGLSLIEQFKSRQFLPQNLLKFFDLSRYDNKLLESFQRQINNGKQLPSPLPQQVEQSDSQALVPQIVEEPSQSSQVLYIMPKQLFRKITKKKSKSKNKNLKPKQEQIEIDLTQQEGNQTHQHQSQASLKEKQSLAH